MELEKPYVELYFKLHIGSWRPRLNLKSLNNLTKKYMRNYYKILLEKKHRSNYAEECLKDNFIGLECGVHTDLSNDLVDDWRDFNHKFIPIYQKENPGRSKVAAGLACGSLWTLCKGINNGDVIICPNGRGVLLFGEVVGDYTYHPDGILSHRRAVRWFSATIKRADISPELNSSIGSPGPSAMITKHAEEIDTYIAGISSFIVANDNEVIEDLAVFALEKHLEDFLVENWKHTEFGQRFDIYEEEGELVGQQYPTDTGPIDILAVSKNKKELLVVELKKGRASDSVVGQIQRYMGYVHDELAEENQEVKGVIIALDDDKRIRRALTVARNIEFFRYQISFKLFKA